VNAKAGTSTQTLSQTTTYTLTAKNSTEEASETITVTVKRAQVLIVRFTATPSSIAPGASTTLAWETQNATEVSIGGIGGVGLNGSSTVSPSVTTTYTLTAKNENGQATATVTVEVVSANRAPVADAGLNQTSMRFPMQLNGSASYDPDGDPITYSWRV
jgi:PKD repeat protein